MQALSARASDRYPSVREMARQLALVLKRSRGRQDLHSIVGREVIEVRAALDIGRKTQEPNHETPIQDADSALMSPAEGTGERRGLLHWLPFGRKRD